MTTWESVCRSFCAGSHNDQGEPSQSSCWEWLPTKGQLTYLDKTKSTGGWREQLRMLSTMFVVDNSLEMVPNDIDRSLCAPVNFHRPLRSRRFFTSLQAALESCRSGDYIFLRKGNYDETVEINIPVHIVGDTLVKERVYLQTVWQQCLTWRAEGGSLNFVSFTGNVPGNILSVEAGSVTIKYCLFKNPGGTGVSIGPQASVVIERSTFSGNKNPIQLCPAYCNVSLQNCYLSDKCGTDFLSAILEKLQHSFDVNTTKPIITTWNDLIKSQLNRDNAVDMLATTGISVLLERIRSDIVDIALAECYADGLHELSKSEPLRKPLNNEHAILAISKLMRSFPHNKTVQQSSCACVWNLALHKDSRADVETGDVAPLLIHAIDRFRDDRVLLHRALGALWNCTWLTDMTAARICEIDGISILLDVATSYKTDPVIAVNVLGVLWNMASQEPISRQLVSAGCIRVVLTLMDLHPTDSKLQRIGCAVVGNFSRPEDIRCLVVEQRGLMLVLDALRRFAEEEETFTRADAALGRLLSLPISKEEFTRLNGFTVLLEAGERHSKVISTPAEKMSRSLYEALESEDFMRQAVRRALSLSPKSNTVELRNFASCVFNTASYHPELLLQTCLFDLPSLCSNLAESTASDETIFRLIDTLLNLIPFRSTNADLGFLESVVVALRRVSMPDSSRFWLDTLTSKLGPALNPIVCLDESISSPGMKVSACGLRCRNNFLFFASTRASRPISRGKCYFEVDIVSDGVMQIGWASPKATLAFKEQAGVGDCSESWAVDLHRQLLWHAPLHGSGSPSTPFLRGRKWDVGDSLQLWLDMDARTLSVGLNGEHLGIVFSDINPAGGKLYPAVSLAFGCELAMRFAAPFKYDSFGWPAFADSI